MRGFEAPSGYSCTADALTLPEVLDWHVRAHPERMHITLLDAEGGETALSTPRCATARNRSRRGCGAANAARPVGGDHAATSRENFCCFTGVPAGRRRAGADLSACTPSQIEDHLRRHAGILSNALATMLITVSEAKPLARLLQAQVESVGMVVTALELSAPDALWGIPRKPEDIALSSTTSGSTATQGHRADPCQPAGPNPRDGQAVQASSTDVFVSWLPLYHDMGLIRAVLGSLYHASAGVMSPATFLARPERCCDDPQASRHAVASPNFGFRAVPAQDSGHRYRRLDLSSWRMAFNGAEPVSPETIAHFAHASQLRIASGGDRAGIRSGRMFGWLRFPPPGRGPSDRLHQARQVHAFRLCRVG